MDLDIFLNKQKFLVAAKAQVRPFDEDLISRAWDFAEKAHQDQKRDTGESFFAHPVNVATNLLDINCDSATIAAALLHDVVEDTKASLKEIHNVFGPDVATLVDGVTKLKPLDSPPERPWTKDEERRENLSKLFVAIVNDPRVALVKLADRLHNLATLGGLEDDRRRKIANESLDVFAPLAEALELSIFQSRIQDQAFRYLEPDKYKEIETKLKEKWEEFKDTREIVVELLEDDLEKVNIEALVYSRQKEIYSTYNKMQSLKLDFERVYDIIGIRVLVNTEEDCYRAKHIVDQLGTEVKYDDYIVKPRGPRSYQSLHKVVLDRPGGTLIEVQIRTKKMHEYDERGPASHWMYKLGSTSADPALIKKVNILRERLGALREEKDVAPEEIINGLEPQIHVFTPKGDVIPLPEGSTPIDFAYHIHTLLGHECRGARVNSKIVPLEYELRDGDTVEVIRRKGSTPKLSWLREGKVKSKAAKQKIRQFFQAQRKQEMIAEGQNIVQKYLKPLGESHIEIQYLVDTFAQAKVLIGSTDVEGLYLAVADGRINTERLNKALGEIIVKRFLEKKGIVKESVRDLAKWFADANMIPVSRDETLFLAVAEGVISAKLLDKAVQELADRASGLPSIAVQKTGPNRSASHHLLFHTAHCCYPVPGDKIVGFVTIGEGLSLHRAICPQALAPDRQKRLYSIEWKELDLSEGATFSGQLIMILTDSNSKIYKDIQQIVLKGRGVISGLTQIGNSNRPYRIALKLDVEDVHQLNGIVTKLRQLEDIIEIKRIVDEND